MSKEHLKYSRLAKITQLINTKLRLREVLDHVVTAISEEIVQRASIGIYLPEENGNFRGYLGKPDIINGMSLDMHVVDPEVDLLAKEVIETKKTIYIPDTSIDDRPDSKAVHMFKINSLLVLPISYEVELYGLVFLFDNGIPMNLSKAEIQTVESYVNIAAVAIRNTKSLTHKENLILEKQLLLDVTRDLSMCSSIQQVLDKCFFYVGKVLNNPNLGAHILDPVAERKIRPAKLHKDSDWAEEDWKEIHQKAKVDFEKDLLSQEVIRTKKFVYIPDVSVDTRPNQEVCNQFGIKSVLMLPLVAMGKVLGIIPVVNLEDKVRNYSETEMQLAQSIVDATASALSNLLFMEKQELIIEERTAELTEKNKRLNNAVSDLKRLSYEKELILNSAGEGIFGLDIEGKITFINPAAVKMLGYKDKEELIDSTYIKIFYGSNSSERTIDDQKHELNHLYWNRINNCSQMDTRFHRKNGESFLVEYMISSIEKENKIFGYVVTFKDITSKKQLEEKIRHLAYYDYITKLPNGILLKDRLEQGIKQAQLHNEQLAVLFIDLDRFKKINDTMGHSNGDILLQKVATRLGDCVRSGDTVSRQGGDEFTIFMPSIKSVKEVEEVAERILDRLKRPFEINGREVFITTSIGISLFPKDGESVEFLIKNADIAMYQSKELAGNNYKVYQSGMNILLPESIKLENSLYRALEREEFELYYQPQLDMNINEIVGIEALIRWNHSEMGMVLPYKFIHLAEETGLIVPIGEWVLKTACKQMKKWNEQRSTPLRLSVNMSVGQFNQENFIQMINNILEETQLEPSLLELELTENLIIQNTEHVLGIMHQLKQLGIRISIDDFGTGYSSLVYLKKLPIDTLKIDRAFVKDVIKNEKDAAITNTIINLAQNLNLNVIAEGVETEEQIEFLTSKNCFLMQGYCFSPPLCVEDITPRLIDKQKVTS